jgi:hypothetical protein
MGLSIGWIMPTDDFDQDTESFVLPQDMSDEGENFEESGGEFEEDDERGEFFEDEVPSLVGDERTTFTQAVQLGRMTRDVTVLGLVVSLSTLTVNQELQIATLIKPYEGSQGYTRAYMTACVAASIDRLDGRPFFTPLNEADKRALVSRKFEKLREYYPIFVDQVYGEFDKLEQESGRDILKKLGKSSG